MKLQPRKKHNGKTKKVAKLKFFASFLSRKRKNKNSGETISCQDIQNGKILCTKRRKPTPSVPKSSPKSVKKSQWQFVTAVLTPIPTENFTTSLQRQRQITYPTTTSTEPDGSVNYEVILYEGYGPSGVAVIVETTTDNRNRTAADVRHYFDKYGGNLGTTGCVSYMFADKGVIAISGEGVDEEQLMMDALEAGAEDITNEDDIFEITTDPADFSAVSDALSNAGYTFISAEQSKVPANYVTLTDEDSIKNMEKLLDMLDDNDDVTNVWHNCENEF